MAYAAYGRADDLNEYQKLAASTAVFPRVYTEHQVRELALGIAFSFADAREWSTESLTKRIEAELDAYETEFSRMVYPVLGLVGEAGEVANKLKKVARDQRGEWEPDQTADYEKEIGDVLWYVAAVASGLRSSLGQIASKNIDKLFSRKARGVLGGSGDNR